MTLEQAIDDGNLALAEAIRTRLPKLGVKNVGKELIQRTIERGNHDNQG